MRPGQQNKRGRGRGNNGNGGNNNFNRKGSNPLTRTFDSSGPDVKIRGTAQHIAEKYAALARDAQSAGDRVMAENYLQHAEHYNRIIAAAQAQMQERFQRDDRGDFMERDEDAEQDGMDAADGADGAEQDEQPVVQQQAQPRQNNQEREHRRDRRERPDRQDRPERQDRQERGDRPERAERAAPVQAAAPVIDDTTPQPVIEGVPAEVAVAEAEAGATGGERTPRRRNAAPRPRRQPRAAAAEGGESEAKASEPALAASE